MNRVLTVLEASIPPERQDDLKAAYHEAVMDSPPPGLVRMLLQDINDYLLWRIETGNPARPSQRCVARGHRAES